MWVPLASKDSAYASLFTVHEIYIIDRDRDTKKFKAKMLMEARYAQLISVNE